MFTRSFGFDDSWDVLLVVVGVCVKRGGGAGVEGVF